VALSRIELGESHRSNEVLVLRTAHCGVYHLDKCIFRPAMFSPPRRLTGRG
jgi:hypothetical protein